MESSYLTPSPELAAIGLPLSVTVMMLLHCLIGLLAAQIAHRRGADLGLWLVWGTIGGTVALITALRLSPRKT
ncbi:hypothetical protein PN498_08225 [Oscillatoria sp. CS-180]|uniref:hypothetical protein n=1 Tax=Oscillatoria sp. CS-180 TaxID=3021720 RepID=UPI00232FEC21|nr:hypothetical protein [Oscillatoria sp. CS-180]MDB9525969.1 hypothetical protein [Oscillatoria sp. CS-180]